ncbi:MAG: metallophosphoesterase [Lachnospiraceae bacterium]|nr:metallophosphoesterase [Lachnospiraceae bacterium]
MWLIIFAVSILAGVACALYIADKIAKTGVFSFTDKGALVKILSVLAVVVIALLLCFIFDITNTIVIFMHFAVFMLAGDLVLFIAKKVSGRELPAGRAQLIAIAACFIYLCIGWILMHGLWETDYLIETDKQVGKFRIAQIADTHVGCGFTGKEFGEKLEKVQAADPDILVITGDLVDDGTMKADMVDACAALGKFRTKYGIYFCLGNHDLGYYSSERRGYSGEELIAELEKNGVHVLRDEGVLIDGRVYLIGRNDAGYGTSSRASAKALMQGIDPDVYTVMLDHQPTDYDAEAAAGVDLVLSGHTHGGQLFPLEYIQPLVSSNDNVRGLERRGRTDFIVTDGFSDWEIKFKTGCKSEYNIIVVEQGRTAGK